MRQAQKRKRNNTVDLIKLKSFITVARLKNFRKASEELYFSQPAISAQIKELENYYNVELFERIGKKIKLTEAGELLLPYAEDLVTKFEESRYYVQNAFQKSKGRIKLGTSVLPGVYYLPSVLAEFRSDFPDIKIDLQVNYSSEIEKAVLDNILHVGIVGSPEGVVFNSNLENIILLKDQLVACIGQNHRFYNAESVAIEDIAEESLILPGKNTFTRKVLEDEVKRKGLKLNIEYEIANNEMIKKMVGNSLGISVLCSSMIEEGKEVRAVPIKDLKSHRHIDLIYRKDRKLSPPLQSFINFTIQASRNS